MKLPERLRFAFIIAGFAAAVFARPGPAAETLTEVSQPAGLHVSMYSELEPLTINQMHSWIIEVRDAQGEPVADAVIRVEGGMPLHNHGLATSPQVTGQGEGRYQLQGMRFHMNGDWELRLQIEHDGTTYRTVFNLTL